MIVEVSGGDATDFGFDWQGLLGQSNNKTVLAAADPDRTTAAASPASC
jgi:type II secretory pathway component GspD/PulD (secretin)